MKGPGRKAIASNSQRVAQQIIYIPRPTLISAAIYFNFFPISENFTWKAFGSGSINSG